MLLSSIRIQNLLSLKDVDLPLKPLNVLIGPNASGKSNLIEAIRLLQAAPEDLSRPLVQGGGADAWIWKGSKKVGQAVLECCLEWDKPRALRYRLAFSGNGVVEVERLEGSGRIFLDRRKSEFSIGGRLGSAKGKAAEARGSESVLSQYRVPNDSTPITRLGETFRRIGVYHGFRTDARSAARAGVSAQLGKMPLDDGGDNLALVLDEMRSNTSIERLSEYVKRLGEGLQKVDTRIAHGGWVTVTVQEEYFPEPTPSIRLSDGILKFLCLMAVLLNPHPQPLICIEEPETGLHPDALSLIAEALAEASERTQLVVTTHSESLVDALSARPESVVVCERDSEGASRFERLSRKRLEVWLKDYSLGRLWRKGEIGGNRW